MTTSQTSTYSDDHGRQNLDRLTAACADLTPDAQRSLDNHLIGALVGFVDPDTFAAMLARARNFAAAGTGRLTNP